MILQPENRLTQWGAGVGSGGIPVTRSVQEFSELGDDYLKGSHWGFKK